MNALILGPLGTNPWFPARDVAQHLRASGWAVDVHNPATGDDVITYPEPYNPRNLVSSFLPYFFVHRFVAFLRWRRDVRGVFGAYRTVFVWDPVLCVMARLARPRGTQIVWTESPPVVEDAWNGVLLRIARALADRTIESEDAWYEAIGGPA